MEFHVFSLGNTTLIREARGYAEFNCLKRIVRVDGYMEFEIKDAFVDALDLRDKKPGNQDLSTGTPFKITAKWKHSLSWTGDF
tara:strand:+ start:6798 stop:7046 length:249 start_codon:yes stop_codon:yes gene_type:complete